MWEDDGLSERARQGLSEYLSGQDWDCWFTATSSKKLSYPRQAIGMVLESVHSTAKGFVGAERHYLGGWHAHGLIKFNSDTTSIHHSMEQSEVISSSRLLEIQLSRRGYNRVESIRNPESVANYVSKYITKNLDSDWEIWGLRSWNQKT